MKTIYRNYAKPILDFLIALFALLLLSPVFLVLLVVLAVINNGHPFFVQPRPGKNEKIFNIVKFKTMTDKKDATGQLLPDMERMTKVGQFLRRTSLDEIPQLLNVLRGNMSIVGPRPLLVDYLNYYNEQEARRHSIKPGITGWAQVNGRNAISWQEKFNHDLWYVDHLSFKTDMYILYKTIQKVMKRDGITASDKETMTYFRGNLENQINY
jgi:undecaprenyl phosphate N,N'-diacetylbacillosamine 1-phosphate transferase|tara:strand:- start:1155 stop:1787 length:633 start_codon:yes stop_codon:yes gene_type:complete